MSVDIIETSQQRALHEPRFLCRNSSMIRARNASILSHLSHLAHRPPTPLHPLHQHPSRLSLPTRLRSLLPLRIQQRRLFDCSNVPRRVYRVFVGVLSVAGDALPAWLRKLRKVDVHTVITLTDNAPQGLNRALLSPFYPRDPSLFASSTPFVTGRLYTHIFNGSVKSSGAIGLTLSAGSCPVPRTAFPGLRTITAPLKVTQSESNNVSELNKANPTELLISAMENSAAKNDEFYIGVPRDSELWQFHHMLTGGPSRGTMALDTEKDPGKGSSVQLRHRSAMIWRRKWVLGSDDDVTVLQDTFVAGSENGFVLSRGSEPTRLTW
ncbi:hypothetical protein EI94DRAFT_1829958 [Lactarius quietus]|nr:hypothetical protein EI94DRAFT_1829958 [Lactarius quietus]